MAWWMDLTCAECNAPISPDAIGWGEAVPELCDECADRFIRERAIEPDEIAPF